MSSPSICGQKPLKVYTGFASKQRQKSGSIAATIPNSSRPVDTVIDQEGDLTLGVGGDMCESRSMLVSRSAMRRTCLAFSNMLGQNSWMEGQTSEVELPDDYPDAVEVLARVAHLDFKELEWQKPASGELLVHLAILCDKYDLSTTFRPFQNDWLQDVEFSARSDELFAYYAFKMPESFFEFALRCVEHLRLTGDGRELYWGEELLNEPEKLYLHPMMTKLRRARTAGVFELQKALKATKNSVNKRQACTAPKNTGYNYACNLLLSGSFFDAIATEGINSLRFFPIQNTSGMRPSMGELLSVIKRIRILSHGDEEIRRGNTLYQIKKLSAKKDHAKCNFKPRLEEAALEMMAFAKRSLVELFRTHFGLPDTYYIED